MDLQLANKVAFVSGASRGIGRAIAESLLKEGCRVVLNARNAEPLKALCSELGRETYALAGDVSQPETAAKLVTECLGKWGQLDILFCNVGSGRSSVKLGQETQTDWSQVLETNFFSATNLVAAALPALTASKGNIVCISSICGVAALGAPVAYSAAKAALNSYVANMARPLGNQGVRINAVAPGNILFPGSVWETKVERDSVGVDQMLQREVALHRFGTPKEIADFATFLASPKAGFATGQVFVVDGGQVR